MKLPAKGIPEGELFKRLEAFREHDVRWRDGRTLAYVYDLSEQVEAVVKRAYAMYLSENALDPTVFPSAVRFENELVAMAAAHLRGGPEVVGNFTSGGTESIMLAVKTARDYARKTRGVRAPEMILPVTAHAAFHKAAHYLGLKAVVTPVDPVSFKADVAAMRAAVTENTVLLVGSAVSYPQCVVDPIVELGQLARERDLLLHVDACMGGFLLPYFRRLGEPVPEFDLSVPGVSSISIDFHKYAFAPKGASIVLYRDAALRRHQIFAFARWYGYPIVNPAVQSAKSVGPMAAAWSVLHYVGDDGYLEMARSLLAATKRLKAGIEAIEGLRLVGDSEMNLVAFTSDREDLCAFHIIDELRARGWFTHPQLSFEGAPANVHLAVNPKFAGQVEPFLKDLAAATAAARGRQRSELVENLLGVVSSLASGAGEDLELDQETFTQLMAMAGVEIGGSLEASSTINEILDALPPALREQALTLYVNALFVPPRESAAT
ncbi:MAG: aspartate aminotransferase family protein [Myxococcales bacterium]|nr:aspartate aminotransferase family protein [Myxococcales bacterium]MCB9753292.1 aspartate aminotransferase family protein [Myxococcales bacterium]